MYVIKHQITREKHSHDPRQVSHDPGQESHDPGQASHDPEQPSQQRYIRDDHATRPDTINAYIGTSIKLPGTSTT